MRKTKSLLSILTFLFTFSLAYGQDYFQQEVNYTIQVELNDKTHELSAFEQIEYINNSPNELEFIYFHLWPNAYKNNQTALAKQKLNDSNYKLFEYDFLRGYIDSLDFKINNQPVKWEYDQEHIDICKIYLNEPLESGQKIIITTPFHVKIPRGTVSRLGHVGQSYQITQWYPKPAVYDKYGWHQMPYLNMGEFYSEFGSFDVTITLPKNYVVGATGDLQNKEELEWLNNLADKTSLIKEFDKSDNIFPKSDSVHKTIRYTQKNIHDFAWFADKRFNVLKSEKELSNNKVVCWAMFLNNEADLWQRSIEYIEDALLYYSKWYGEYPYKQCTAVHSSISAGSGMEYPNITVIGDSRKDLVLETVIMHEVGHNWFYGMLGFNEREFPWLDEGLNSFSEARYMEEKYNGNDKLYKMALTKKQAKLLNIEDMPYKTFHQFSYLMSARFNLDQKPSLHSIQFTESNYGQIIYHKTSCVFDHLHAYLGEEKFNQIMQDFFVNWQYKHPYPEDVQKAFEDGSGEDLSWIFDDMINSTKKLDYKILSAKDNKVIVKNKGMINAPFPISGFKNNEIQFTQWVSGFDGKQTIDLSTNTSYDYLIIDPNMEMPEMYRNNNYIRKKGLFKKIEPVHLQIAGIAENSSNSNLYMFPAMGWNQYNNYMLGLVFYNSFIPRNKFEYQLIPMYSFGNKNIAGYANFEYHILPYESVFREITVGLSGKRYAYSSASDENFHSVKAQINFHLKKKDPRSKIKNNIRLSGILADNIDDISSGINPDLQTFINLDFIHQNSSSLRPYTANIGAQYNPDFIKTNAELNYKIKYKRTKAINLRLFAGAFLYKSDDISSTYNYGLSGHTGSSDYTYDQSFLGRFESPTSNGFLGKQYLANDGGFAIYSPHFTSSEWIVAFNGSAAIPGLPNILNFHVYGNMAIYGTPDDYMTYENSEKFAWECGIQYRIAGKSIIVSLPLFMSKQLNDYSDAVFDKFYERIRFSMNLSKVNPFKLFENQIP
ncbi:MAG: M1 family metallopeptidase [Bacteroidales bacterium]|nr:M1 family metallopeptidase [Bacteroidales bacterium]